MKTITRVASAVARWIWVCSLLLGLEGAFAQDFTVTSPDFFYDINGMEPNPTLTLVRGRTYTFFINADPIHPFYIASAGVVNNNTNFGTITYTVPTVASNYIYFCSIHGFGGDIITVEPSSSSTPTIQIVGVVISTNIILRSTGTNTWSVIPEYKTNVTATNWLPLTVQTNRFLLGTNETICGRPPGNAVFMRIRSQPN